MAAVNYAEAYERALAQAYPNVLNFGELYNVANNRTYKFVDSKTIHIPSISVTGRKNVNRDSIDGVFQRNVDNEWETKTLTFYREWSTSIDPADVMDTNMVLTIQNATQVFNETQKFPEKDAYTISKIYADWVAEGKTADTTVLNVDNVLAVFDKLMEIPEDKIKEASIIDIQLKDLKGNTRSLTDLKGKVVLIDFTVYNNAMSAAHNLALRELYNKYASQGFEIYQISLDGDEHFWKTSADNLPWVCVRDANGAYSSYISLYNVTNLPSVFLVNRNNELSARGENIKDLDEAIKKLL